MCNKCWDDEESGFPNNQSSKLYALTPNDKGTIRKRVKRGAQLLDDRRKTWFRSVDVASLDMNDGVYCILGQTYANYLRGLQKVGLQDKEGRWDSEIANKYGFVFNDGEFAPKGYDESSPEAWSFLAECWSDEIAFRKAVAKKRR